MSLIIVEGARSSGKTYLLSQQTSLPVYKFDFNSSFAEWNFKRDSPNVHWFGLGKEVMLHELNQDGFLPKMLVDRGVLTNSVWGVFQGRVSEDQARKDLVNFNRRGLFNDTQIILIEGKGSKRGVKDIWDEDEKRGNEERALFSSFAYLLQSLGVEVSVFHNNMDLDSVIRFKTKISKI